MAEWSRGGVSGEFNEAYLVHYTEEGAPYYEDKISGEVVWELPEDELPFSPPIRQTESSRGDSFDEDSDEFDQDPAAAAETDKGIEMGSLYGKQDSGKMKKMGNNPLANLVGTDLKTSGKEKRKKAATLKGKLHRRKSIELGGGEIKPKVSCFLDGGTHFV